MITKDIRKTENPRIISKSEIELNGINYSKVGNTITRNGDVIARDIEIFLLMMVMRRENMMKKY